MALLETMSLDPRFRLRAPLRCDGVGRLDWGEDTSSRTRVAVRWLPVGANGEAAARACAELPVHPVLPRILQIGRLQETAFVVMEFPDGELLSSRLADGEWLDERGALGLGGQLAQALAVVHRHGLVHGELCPGSVLFGHGERILFWDVPLVLVDRMTDRRPESRPLHQLVKTAASLAPECARGERSTEGSDVYSLAAVLCLATGAPAPSAASTLGVLHQVATGAWAPRVTQAFPERVAALMRRMLDPEATARPTAAEVAAVFDASAGETAPGAGVTLELVRAANVDSEERREEHPAQTATAGTVESASAPELVAAETGPLEERPLPMPHREVASEGLRFAVVAAVIGVLAALGLVLAFLGQPGLH